MWLLEIRAGVYVGNYSRRTREMIWGQVKSEIADGDAIIAWAARNDAGYDFDTCGDSRRIPVDFDGVKLVQFCPCLPAPLWRITMQSRNVDLTRQPRILDAFNPVRSLSMK